MQKPWYKQFWPWFIIAIPTISVVYSMTALYVFSQNKVDLVAEDYYKKGKGINQDFSRLRVADALQIHGDISVQDTNIVLRLNKGELKSYPTLRVMFTHRTLAEKDFTQMISPDMQGNYRFSAPEPIDGPWFVEVEPFKGDWMLNSRLNLPSSDPIQLYGQKQR
ncbi:FixH family protein [Photobacterium galatheae]|uniref:CcoH n=1 Tax=Photobacterium galatheae TaxID=1654360 RepID=A0A066RQN5_9GAMM|nr:FixH family protein [Photobacterium galatheae]KDM91446.1 CcoH [Photobacterium galatheae]MCM0149518.1 FixH family protein [Photobacterium galatheae]